MLNLAQYFECHPGALRHLRLRHKRLGLVVFLVICLVFFAKEYQLLSEHGDSQLAAVVHGKAAMRHQFNYNEHHTDKEDDEIVMLKAQLGYLKKKLAGLGKSVDVNDPSLPIIYVITPTHTRPEQKAEMVRVSQTFLLVPNLHWIVVEDSKMKTDLVGNLLAKSGLSFTHLNVETPPESKLTEKDPHWLKPRGVIQRNEALHFLRDKFRDSKTTNGVIYFADDDNTYHTQLFEEMRSTQGVSVWPVGLAGGLMLERPKMGQSPSGDGKQVVVGWDVSWSPHRPFAIDMAGFAVNLQLFLTRPKAKFAYRVKRGHQESEFLRHLVSDLKELEPKADLCTKVYVWHTRTEKVNLVQEQKRKTMNLPASNLNIEV